MHNTAKQKLSGSVTFYDTRPGNKVGLFYNTAEPTQGGNSDESRNYEINK